VCLLEGYVCLFGLVYCVLVFLGLCVVCYLAGCCVFVALFVCC